MPATLPPRALAALAAAAARLDAAGVPWLVAGSAGRALLGHPVRPADVDIEIGPGSVAAAERALAAVFRRSRGAGRDSLRAATRLAGIGVDVTCDLAVEGPTHRLEPDFALQRRWARPIGLGGRPIWVAPPEEGIARALVVSDWPSLAKMAGGATRGDGTPGGAPGGARAPGDGLAAPIRPDYVALRLSSAIERAAR